MGYDTPLLVVPFILIALVAMVLAGEAWRRSRTPGSLSFALLMLVVTIWLLAAAGSISMPVPEVRLFWAKVAYLSTAWLGSLWLLFSLEFTYPNRRPLERFGWVLWIVPIITQVLVVSNDLHGLFWPQVMTDPASNKLIFTRGIWLWIFIGYSYLLLGIGTVILVRGMLRQPVYRRRQVATLVLGMLLPWLAHISYLVGWIPQTFTDLTPFTFAISGILYTWSLFRLGLFDPIPLAREMILEQIDAGYLALDKQNRVLDANLVARDLLRLGHEPLAGQAAETVLAGWPALLDLLREQKPNKIELVTAGDPPVSLEASLSPWFGRGRQFAGRVLILYNISGRKNIENQLRDSERLYRMLVCSSPVGIFTTDENGKVTFASPEVNGLLGVPEHLDLTGRNFLDWIHPSDRLSAQVKMQNMRTNQEKPLPQVYRLQKASQSVFWGEISSSPLPEERGKPRGMLVMMRDVTQQKLLEIRLQRKLEEQTFINDLLQILYRPHDITIALAQVLERTGLFTQASRVYLCQDTPDGKETSIVLEWCNNCTRPRAREAPLLRYADMPAWRDWLENRGIVLAPRVEVTEKDRPIDVNGERPFTLPDEKQITIPPDIAEYMMIWNVLSLAAFPVYGGEERLYGFLGIEDCARSRVWSCDELDLLWNVCKVVSGAVTQLQVEEAESGHRAMTEALHDTAQALNSTLNMDEVFDRILANLERVARHDAASIAMINDEGLVYFVRWRGYDEAGGQWMRNHKIPLADRETYNRMAQTGQPVIINDTWVDKRWVRYPEYQWIRSYVGVPIQIKGKVVGFINIDSGKPDFFTPEIANRLRIFADQAGIAIENARLYYEAHRRVEEMSILYRIGMMMTTGLEINQILVTLYEQCRKVLPVDVFYVALYDAKTSTVDHGIFYEGDVCQLFEPCNIADAPGISGAVILERRTIYLPDASLPEVQEKYQLAHRNGAPSRSYVGVPLILLNQVVGVISMQNDKPYAYTEEQVRLLETIATQAAIAVQNARLYEQMRQMAITDTVTELFTRRHFTMLGHNEVERALRYNRALSVLMVDIDRFKKINDTYGHSAGDQVLLSVAKICLQALRQTDIVGRWGGEEFTIVLPEADRDGAVMIAERIRRMVEETVISLTPQIGICLTVSIGVATLCPECNNLEDLVDCADRALYVAKQAGRNRVKVGEG